MSKSSGTSPHLGDANITLVIASFRSMGQILRGKGELDIYTMLINSLESYDDAEIILF